MFMLSRKYAYGMRLIVDRMSNSSRKDNTLQSQEGELHNFDKKVDSKARLMTWLDYDSQREWQAHDGVRLFEDS